MPETTKPSLYSPSLRRYPGTISTSSCGSSRLDCQDSYVSEQNDLKSSEDCSLNLISAENDGRGRELHL